MDSPALAAVDQVVRYLAAQVGVIDTVVKLVGMAEVANVMDDVADDIVIVSCAVLMVHDTAAEYAGAGITANIVDIVSHDPRVGGIVDDPVAGSAIVARDVEAFN